MLKALPHIEACYELDANDKNILLILKNCTTEMATRISIKKYLQSLNKVLYRRGKALLYY